jgi:hypothetical protein
VASVEEEARRPRHRELVTTKRDRRRVIKRLKGLLAGYGMRRSGIVALARKLLIALWRFLETGVVPEGAVLKVGLWAMSQPRRSCAPEMQPASPEVGSCTPLSGETEAWGSIPPRRRAASRQEDHRVCPRSRPERCAGRPECGQGALKGIHVSFASPDIAEKLAGSVAGTVLPFSFNPELELVVDPSLLENDELYFNAARLDRAMVLKTSDDVASAQPCLERIVAVRGTGRGIVAGS